MQRGVCVCSLLYDTAPLDAVCHGIVLKAAGTVEGAPHVRTNLTGGPAVKMQADTGHAHSDGLGNIHHIGATHRGTFVLQAAWQEKDWALRPKH